MDSQKFTLLISLGSSLAVVLISSAANVWSKRIDVKQKRQDQAFEFSKIYLMRKIDAAEDIISNNALLLVQARTMNQLLAAYVRNYGHYHTQGDAQLDREADAINALIQKSKSTYRLYFDRNNNRDKLAEASTILNELLSDIMLKLKSKKMLTDDVSDDIVIVPKENDAHWSKLQKELEELLIQYQKINNNYQSLLIDDCNFFREQLKKYDIGGS
jgi:hypothetical protein